MSKQVEDFKKNMEELQEFLKLGEQYIDFLTPRQKANLKKKLLDVQSKLEKFDADLRAMK